jgi:hypothetical protein
MALNPYAQQVQRAVVETLPRSPSASSSGTRTVTCRGITPPTVQLVISYVDGAFEDAWVTDDPAREERYCQPNEELLVGTWSELAA